MTEESPLYCGRLAHPRFRKQNEHLTRCVREPGHDGNHVYCVKVRAGVTIHSHALHFQEEVTRTSLKPVMIAEMRGQHFEPIEDIAAIYQYFEVAAKHARQR